MARSEVEGVNSRLTKEKSQKNDGIEQRFRMNKVKIPVIRDMINA